MNPILFRIGPIPITSFGLSSSLGTLLAFLCIDRRARDEGVDPEVIVDLFLVMLLSGFAGARLMYVVTYPAHFVENPLLILELWTGGLTFYGGLIGGSVGVFSYLKYWKLPVLSYFDLWMPFMALAHAFGRNGCFWNGCCYGVPTGSDWGWLFPTATGEPALRHATQLYEAGGLFLLAIVLNRMWVAKVRGGRVLAAYLGLYACMRFVLEFFRGDTLSESFLFGTTLAQTTALGMVAAVAVAWRFLPGGEGAPLASGVAKLEEDPEA